MKTQSIARFMGRNFDPAPVRRNTGLRPSGGAFGSHIGKSSYEAAAAEMMARERQFSGAVASLVHTLNFR